MSDHCICNGGRKILFEIGTEPDMCQLCLQTFQRCYSGTVCTQHRYEISTIQTRNALRVVTYQEHGPLHLAQITITPGKCFLGNASEFLHKASDHIAQPEKRAQFRLTGVGFCLSQSFTRLPRHLQLARGDHVAEVVDRLVEREALFKPQCDTSRAEEFQQGLHMLKVLLKRSGKGYDVVQVHQRKLPFHP